MEKMDKGFESKKTRRADLESNKTSYFLMGVVVALAGIFVAFEWGNKEIVVEEVQQTYVIEEVEDIQITPPDEDVELPPPPPPEEVVVDVIDIVEDDVEVADVSIASVDDSQKTTQRTFTPPAPSQVGTGRQEQVAEDHIFEFLEEMPEFPGGQEALFKWLGDNINYPPIAAENNIQGRVVVSFVVERDGSVSDVKVVRGVDPNLDREAVRVVKQMPKWKPGMQTGKPVRYRYNLPVTFRLR